MCRGGEARLGSRRPGRRRRLPAELRRGTAGDGGARRRGTAAIDGNTERRTSKSERGEREMVMTSSSQEPRSVRGTAIVTRTRAKSERKPNFAPYSRRRMPHRTLRRHEKRHKIQSNPTKIQRN
uniref:Uncharacterized protein n=1 Tax=Oryza glumipatula TaxID=40148 RepID=A0A0D9YVD5_9ORYZ